MLAEQLGNQLAKGKGIGIAKQLAAAHPRPGTAHEQGWMMDLDWLTRAERAISDACR
jgi:Rod binding domain-containing protein